MKGKEIHPAVAGVVIAIVVSVAVYFVYSGTNQKMSSFDHEKMRQYAAGAGMRLPGEGSKSGNVPSNSAR